MPHLEKLAERLFALGYEDTAQQVAVLADERRWAEEQRQQDYEEEEET